MTLIDRTARKAPPLSWEDIDADERRHDDDKPAVITADDGEDDITDIAPLAPVFLRYPNHVEEDLDADERRARLMAREPAWPDSAAPSGRVLAVLSILVILAVVALVGITFTA